MAFDSLSQQNAPTPFHTLTKNSQCVSKVFAFWLNRNPDDEDGGELTVCGTDPGHYTGNIIYTPITDKRYWQFAVNSVKVYGLTAVSNFQAIADTGSTLIIGPPSDIKQIFSRIGVSYGSSGGTMVSCYGYLPDITFVINSQEFTLSRDQYVVKQNGNCFVGLVGADMDGLWILGDVFLGPFYSIYDPINGRIGFAKSTSWSGATTTTSTRTTTRYTGTTTSTSTRTTTKYTGTTKTTTRTTPKTSTSTTTRSTTTKGPMTSSTPRNSGRPTVAAAGFLSSVVATCMTMILMMHL